MERGVGALEMEVVITATIQTPGISEDSICAGDVNESRILREAVLIGERGVLPVVQRLAGHSLPERDGTGGGGVQIIVIALEPHLAAWIDTDVETRQGPENIIFKVNIRAVRQNPDGITGHGIYRVVKQILTAVAAGIIDDDSGRRVGIDQITRGSGDCVVIPERNPRAIRVDHVILHKAVGRTDPDVGIVKDAVTGD